jgi:hypothetical protein
LGQSQLILCQKKVFGGIGNDFLPKKNFLEQSQLIPGSKKSFWVIVASRRVQNKKFGIVAAEISAKRNPVN